jgi:sulfur-carrier protein
VTAVRVALPAHLRGLARVTGEVRLELPASGGPPTVGDLLDALEARYPMLEGTIREHDGGARRAFIRFFACGDDLSQGGMEVRLPDAVVRGRETFVVLGAIAGG